jgi:shikimate kinase
MKNITFIGMSTVGKSYWSVKLQDIGFTVIDVDMRASEFLIGQTNSQDTMHDDLAKWLGLPHEPQFDTHEKLWLQAEEKALIQIIQELQENQNKLIIDAGGSLVYAPETYWKLLKNYTTVVYLKMDNNLRNQLITNYLNRPRAVVWDGVFQPNIGESVHETYFRCYNDLLVTREKLYEKYADISIEYAEHRNYEMTATDFLSRI